MSLPTDDRQQRRVFWINVCDLVFFWGGDTFASATIVMPLFVSQLTSSTLAVGLVATLYNVGVVVPQLLSAGYVRHKRLKKPFSMLTFGVQRLSLFLLALAALTLGGSPGYLLASFYVIYLIGCAGIGAGIPAYQDVIAKIVPVERRGRLRGTGIFIASLLGVGIGILAKRILEVLPFPTSFALCFFLAGLAGTISLGFVSLNPEPAAKVTQAGPSFTGYLRELPGILSADGNFRRYLISRTVFSLSGMAISFLPVYALARFGLGAEEMGTMTATLMAGQTLSVLLLGMLGDRRGHKLVLEIGAAALTLALGIAVMAPGPVVLLGAFALLGCSNAALQVSGSFIVLEFAPPADRSTYVALASTLVAPTTILAPLLGGWLAGAMGYPTLFLAALLATLAGLVSLRLAVGEPRRFAEVRHY